MTCFRQLFHQELASIGTTDPLKPSYFPESSESDECSCSETLSITQSTLSDDFLSILSSSLGPSQCLQTIRLSNCSFSLPAFSNLCSAIPNSNLSCLCLDVVSMTNVDLLEPLISLLQAPSPLKFLSLRCCDISQSPSFDDLLQSLRINKTLSALSLFGNNLTQKSAHLISILRGQCSLSYLDLSHCYLSKSDVITVLKEFQPRSCSDQDRTEIEQALKLKKKKKNPI
ncbi:hypothetical protein GEMRC1_006957 [Eukaryota sp. GEM-RC1]